MSLNIEGVPITDSDADGLDDNWEMTNFHSLAYGPKDDPDGDGYSNAREQIMKTNPTATDVPFQLDLSRLDQKLARLSWPGSAELFFYSIYGGTNVNNLTRLTVIPGKFPVTEWFTLYTNSLRQFFRVEKILGP